ncbi:hypothetical protein B0H11DRAFT_1911573 [Mycena galericulata]|nr:hypothetical protein B0H11DRAFT_1911573 [Mycena galericulata]
MESLAPAEVDELIKMVPDEGLEGTFAHAVVGVVCELGVPASGAERDAAGSQRYGDMHRQHFTRNTAPATKYRVNQQEHVQAEDTTSKTQRYIIMSRKSSTHATSEP